MNLLELGSLLVISFSHSDRIILIHKVAFGIFLTASFIYFYLNWYLYRYYTQLNFILLDSNLMTTICFFFLQMELFSFISASVSDLGWNPMRDGLSV